jgi:hypothetical protein
MTDRHPSATPSLHQPVPQIQTATDPRSRADAANAGLGTRAFWVLGSARFPKGRIRYGEGDAPFRVSCLARDMMRFACVVSTSMIRSGLWETRWPPQSGREVCWEGRHGAGQVNFLLTNNVESKAEVASSGAWRVMTSTRTLFRSLLILARSLTEARS